MMDKNRSFETKFTPRWIYRVIVALILALVLCYWLAGRHFVIHENGISVIEKQSLAFRSTFFNVCDWKFDNFQQYPALYVSLERAGLSEILRASLLKDMTPELRQAIEPLRIPTDSHWLRSHYVILSEHGISIIPRKYIKFEGNKVDTFFDIRSWTNEDFERNRGVRVSLIAAGYRNLLIEMKTTEIGDSLDEMTRSMKLSTDELIQNMKVKWEEIFGVE